MESVVGLGRQCLVWRRLGIGRQSVQCRLGISGLGIAYLGFTCRGIGRGLGVRRRGNWFRLFWGWGWQGGQRDDRKVPFLRREDQFEIVKLLQQSGLAERFDQVLVTPMLTRIEDVGLVTQGSGHENLDPLLRCNAGVRFHLPDGS